MFRVVDTDTLPLTAAQSEVWTAQHLLGDRRDFVITLLVEVTGVVDLARVRDAVRTTLMDAEALHVRMDFSGEHPVQRPDGRDWDVDVVDLSGDDDPVAAAHAWIADDVASADVTGVGPLFRTALLVLADDHLFWHQRYHHGIVDGFGMSLIFNEVRARYVDPTRRTTDDAWALGPLVESDRDYRSSPAFAVDKAFWTTQLIGAAEPPILLPDVPDVGRAVTERVEVSTADAARLHDLAARVNLRRTRMIPSLWLAYLAVATGSYDLTVSLPATGRVGRRQRSTPFMASTILPLRLRLDPSMTLVDVARAFEHATIGTVRHGRFRGEDVVRAVREIEPERRVVGPGLNVLMLPHGVDIGGVPARMHSMDTGPVRDLDTTVTGGLDGEPVTFDLRCRPGALEAMRGHRDRFRVVLDQLLDDPTRPLSSLTLLGDDDRRRILVDFVDTAEPVTRETIPAMFARRVASAPDDVAVELGDRTLTYRQLADRVNQLAHRLLDDGLAPEEIVAVSMPRSIEMVVALLAVTAAGGAFVPVDPEWPAERRARVLADCRTSIVLGGTDHPVALDDWAYSEQPTAVPDVTIDGARAAYVIFTSGSTGTPKGAVIRHEAICARIAWQRDRILGFGPGDASLFKAPLAFDISINEILLPLLTGGRLVIAEPGGERDGLYLLDVIRRRGVTFVYLVSSMLDALLALDDPDRPALAGLKHVWCGGEVLTPELFARFRSRLSTTLYHGYGPAEATIGVSHVVYTGDAPRIATSIGRPNPNTRLYVLDSSLAPTPIGVTGELYAAGFLLGRGYVGAPGITASRFVADPFAGPDESGARLYRTGDLARWTADGTLDFLGRADNQVKIRGMRLELEEVEAALSGTPGVRRVVVDVRRTPAGSAFLAAYVVPDSGAVLHAADVLDHAATVLPDYMVPSTVTVLDALPLTVNGKVDRRALPDPEQAVTGTVAPRTDRERELCAVVAEALGLPEVGVTDDFFALGGDSIVALTVVAKARARGIAIGPRDVFSLRTPEALAAAAPDEVAPVADEPTGVVPLTPVVARALRHGAIRPRFHQTACVPVPAGTDADSLRDAVQAVVDRHPALWASWHDGALHVPEAAPRIDVVHEAAASVDGVVSRLDHRRSGGAVAVALSDDTAVLAVHHLVVDGVSWRILLGDLATALSGGDVPPSSTSVRRWSEALTEYAAAGEVEAELPYWHGVARTPRGSLPTDADPGLAGDLRRRTVVTPASVTEAVLQDVPSTYGAGPTDVVLAALALTLASWSAFDGERTVVEVEGHGREEDVVGTAGIDLTRTVGWFTSVRPVPLPTDRPDDPAETLLAVRDELRRAPASTLGHGVLQELRSDPVLVAAPAPRILVNYLGRLGGAGSVTFHGADDPAAPAAHALILDVLAGDGPSGPRLETTVRWSPAVLTDDDVASFVDGWTDALARLAAAGPEVRRTPTDFPLVELTDDDVAGLPDDVEDVVPTTAVQDGIHFHSAFADDDPYVVQQVIDLGGTVDPDLLRAAVQRVVDRHAALRTSFRPVSNGRIVAVVHTGVGVPFDVQSRPVDDVLAAHRRQGLALDHAPLLRYTLVPTESGAALVQSIHHLVADGWSIPVMLRELLASYGDPAPLPAPASPREWLRHLATRDREASLQRWREALDGVRDDVPVPSHGASGTGTGSHRVEVDPETTAAVLRTARDAGVTVGALLHAAWGVVLGRVTGRRDVTVGSTVSGRTAPVPGLDAMVGLFIDTVPTRVRLDTGDTADTIGDVARRWQRDQADLLDHHHVGLPELRRIAGVASLFETLVVVENYPIGDLVAASSAASSASSSASSSVSSSEAGGLRITGVRVDENPAYPLTLIVIPGDRLTVDLKFHRSAVAEETVAAMVEMLLAVATAPAHTPVTTAGVTPAPAVLGAAGRLGSATVVDLLDRQAAATPTATALVHGDTRLTYAELQARTDRVATALVDRGAGPGSLVAVALPRSIDLVVALVAVLKSGAAYLPLDPGYPADRLRYMIDDAQPAVMVDGPLPEQDPRPLVRPRAADPAYVLYTSGSTGRPKGVVVTHGSVVPRLEWMREHSPLGPGEVVLQKTPSSFDVSVSEFFGPLISGAALVLADPDGHRDSAHLVATIRAHQVTWVHFVPSMLDAFLTDPEVASCTSLRVITCSGEALPAASARRVAELLSHVRLDNLYGPTEAAVDVTAAQGVEGTAADTVPLGFPMVGVEARVLDGWLGQVAPGMPGELYLSGPQLARGYLRRPALTATRFVAAPYGQRRYRTGDVVRWSERTGLEYLGRADDQVKVRGFRIELAEIDAVLREHPAVDRAATVVRTDRGTAQVVSFVVGPVDDASVRAFVRERLPEHMIPSSITVLDDLPTGPSGKLDRAALLAATRDAGSPPTAGPSADDVTAALQSHLGTVLGETVGPDDDFFARGGDSILAIRVVNLARAAGLELSPRQIFDLRTPRALAAAIGDGPTAAPAPAADSAVGTVRSLPVVHRLSEWSGTTDRFCQAALLVVPPTAEATVAAVIDALVRHHDSLRLLRDRHAPGVWTTEIRADGVPSLRRVDARGLGDAALRDLVARESDRATDALDPDGGTVLSVVWFDRGDDPGRLLLVAHHLVVDGVSWSILVEDLAVAWVAVESGDTPALAPVRTSLREFSRRVDEDAHSAQRLAELSYWRTVTAPGAALVSGDAADATVAHGDTLRVRVPADLTSAALGPVADLVRGDATDVIVAALRVALSRWGVDHDVLMDLERHGRHDALGDLSRTTGWFTSIAPVRTAHRTDVVATLAEVKDRLRAAPDGGIGYGMLRYGNARTAGVLATGERSQVLVNHLGRVPAPGSGPFEPAPEQDALRTEPDADLGGPYRLVVNTAVEPGADGAVLVASLAWSASHLSRGDVDTIVDGWLGALRDLATAAESSTPVLTRSDAPLIDLTDDDLAAVADVVPDGVETVWPLTPLQEGLYFEALTASGRDVYTAQFVLEFDHRVDPDRLRSAADGLVRRHPTLRTAFVSLPSGAPAQVVAVPDAVAVPITVVEATSRDEVAAALAADRGAPFDLAAPPLWRLLLVRRPDGTDALAVNRQFLVWDGWSNGLVVAELLARYADPAAVPTTPDTAFTRYLGWLADRDRDAARAAWARAMAGLDEPTLLARPGTVAGPDLPRRHRVEFDRHETTTLRDALRTHGVTLNAVVTAALALALSRSTGRDDVTFGITVAGRPTEVPGLDTAPGMFLATVPARVTLDPAQTLIALARTVQDQRWALADHDHLGLAEIGAATGHRTLFDTLCVVQNFTDGDEGTSLGGRGVRGGDSIDHTTYPVTVVVTPGSTLAVTVEHRPEMVDDVRAQRVADDVVAVLRSVAGGAERPVVGVLADPTPPVRVDDSVPDVTVTEMLVETAQRRPDAVALVSGSVSLTYRELVARIEALARVLEDRGVGPEQVVALAVPRSVDTVVALFAVLRTGAAYLPLELDHPDARLDAVLDDADPRCLIVGPSAVSRFAGRPGVLPLDWAAEPLLSAAGRHADGEGVADGTAFAPGRPGRLEHPAYVIYTSGSTGRPKGVVTPYRGLTNMQLNHRREIFDPVIEAAGGRTLRIAHTVSFAFDMSWEELLWLVEGHEVHVADETLRRDADALVAYGDRHGIDVVNVTPTYASILLERGLLDGYRPALVLLGGEAVGDDVWSALRAADGVLGYNLYGPTEYTINTLGGGTADSATPTVGLPIRATDAVILDGWLRPVPDGVAGELYVAGAGLARGYAHRPALTADRFVAGPNGTRRYRTGDLVRRRTDGSGLLDYLGRTDDQVKIRGHRVEIGEVASAVAAVPGVRRSAVVVGTGPGGLARLIAYVDAPETVDVRDACARALPEYLVPTVVRTDEFPMTVNGKLDVTALPTPEDDTAPITLPRTETERVLTGIVSDVLGVPIGVTDDFFARGGHSLLATRVIGRARTALGCELAVRDLFDAPTVARLAAVAGARSGSARPVLAPRERPEHIPMSAAQRRLWLAHTLDPRSTAYHFPLVIPLDGVVDVEALTVALADVVDRHEALRTVFDEVDGLPVQRILDGVRPAVDVVEATTASDVSAAVAEVFRTPFDLRRDIPLRARAIHTEGGTVLVVVLHHITTDEWSDRPFLTDLLAAYTARLAGDPSPVTPLPVQYADYTLWHAELLGDARDERSLAARQLRFWRDTLAGAPDPEIPPDRPRPPRPSHDGAVVQVDVEPAVVRGLRAVARSTEASVFMALHAAAAVLMRAVTGSSDVVLGAPVAGRDEEATADLVGFFVNTLALRTEVTGSASLADTLRTVRDADLAAFAHADVPFDEVVAHLAPERSAARHPLFQVMVSHHTGPLVDTDRLPETPAKFDVVFNATEDTGGERLTLQLEYATDLYDASTARTLADRFLLVLAALARTPERRVDDLDLFLPGERHRVVTEFNDTARHVPEETLYASYRRWVRATPDAVAVADEHETVTYAALHERVVELAAQLRDRGIGDEDIVGIGVPRSVGTVVATLAVLAVGAAYLPLDGRHPAERLEFMLGDSGAALLLTTEEASGSMPSSVPHLAIDALPERDWADEPNGPAALDSAAYVIYTSGSTGRPKGVVVPHEGISSLVATAEDRMRLTTGSVVLQFASIGFDVAVFELAMALCTGSRLVVVPDDARVAGPELTDFCTRHAVTHAILPPSLMAALPPDCLLPEGCTVLVGTETVPPAVISAWSERLNLLAAYGLTEATVNNTLWQARPGWTAAVPIGVPDPNEQAYVLDARLRPVPIGVAGELYIAGRGLARGYLGRPDLTSHRFVADPHGGGRMYRTGDRARWRTDGSLDFLGRADDQLKVRGFRIEPGEVMAALASADGVDQTAVIAVGDGPATRVVGYVTGVDGLLGEDVRAHAATALPDYMVPSVVMVLPGSLPLTPNGKLDRAALPEPDLVGLLGGRPPRTETERVVLAAAAEVLGLANGPDGATLGIDDDFFDVGGHSMAAMGWVSALRSRLGVEVTVRDVFDAPTAAALAERLTGRSVSTAPTLTPRADRPAVVPLAPMQEAALPQDLSAAPAHHALLVNVGDRSGDDLAAALSAVAARHEPLRSVIAPDGASVTPADPVILERVAVSADGGDLGRRAFEIAQEPLDLTTRPGLRAVLLDDGDRRALLLVMHYAAVDEWSVVPLLTELLVGSEEDLPLTYSDVARWAVDRRAAADDVTRYWRERLADAPPATLPITFGENGTDAVLVDVDADLRASLDRLAATAGTGLASVMHAAFALAVADAGGGEDVTVATLVAGRDDARTHAMVGGFADRVPLRVSAIGDLAEVTRAVRDATIDALDRPGPSYRDIVDAACRPDLRRPALALVHHRVADLGGVSVLPIPVGRPEADLTLSVHEPPTGAALFVQLVVPGGTDSKAVGRFVDLLTARLGEARRP
ncbi:non-ribosomal peptide synthetase [Rhodococcoides corynebacterioides]|uniref:Amino acid adenylation domain-containing protein n=1 Tax=Rhodococcoides corynebacterioides TaxID=53972 RepID=A0ABS7NYC1_9NOCA|nr:non-ribosomal peptide synthetase [Rhodococcus corynebacterioides]MBY6365148.1 amino acid adenylation domain-containing protein [Rhodococcus corynebacterioides]MBY6406560.1 amino acid adenylation domain-containing protein [Rhodococcus corynebacterioides]